MNRALAKPRLGILGPIEAWCDDRRLDLGGPRQVALLAYLLVHANQAVPSDVLLEALWGPTRCGADNRLQMAVARLRKSLSPLDGSAGLVLAHRARWVPVVSGAELDWRYYLVRYPTMREGNSGIYYGANHALGYQMTMLRKSVQRSWYRDPYLYAIWRESGSPEEVTDPWFYGYSTDERWMRLERSGTALRSVPAGIALQAPTRQDQAAAFKAVCSEHSDIRMLDERWLLAVAQTERHGALVDVEDRVQKAAAFLRVLITADL